MKFRGRLITLADKRRYKFYTAKTAEIKLKYLMESIPGTKEKIKRSKMLLQHYRSMLSPHLSWGRLNKIVNVHMEDAHHIVRYYTEILDWQRACLSEMWKNKPEALDTV